MRKKIFFIILLLALALTGAGLILVATSTWGVNWDEDGVFFICLAKAFGSYNDNKEMVGQLLLHFQPLYALCISFTKQFGIDLLQGTRWLNSTLFALNIIIFGLVIRAYTGSFRMALSGALLMMVAPDMVKMHIVIMSEPLLIFFILLWLWAFICYIKQPNMKMLLSAAIVVGLAIATKYSGLILMATGIFGIAFLTRSRWEKKNIHVVVYILVSCLLPLLLLAAYSFATGNLSNKKYSLHLIGWSYWKDAVPIYCSWIGADRFNHLIQTFVFSASILGLVIWANNLWLIIRRSSEQDLKKLFFCRISLLLLVFIFFFITFFSLSASFLNNNMTMRWRYLLLVHAIGLVLLCGVLHKIYFQQQNSLMRTWGVKIIICYIFLFYGFGAGDSLLKQYVSGDEYSTGPLRFSEIIWRARMISPTVPIYTNNWQSVYILVNRVAGEIPSTRDFINHRENDRYEEEFSRMKKELDGKNGFLIYFNEDSSISGSESIESLKKKMSLRLVFRDPYGAIFGVE